MNDRMVADGIDHPPREGENIMNSKKQKLIALTSPSAGLDCVISVENFDGKFVGALRKAEKVWEDSTDEYHDVVFDELRNAGYKFEEVSVMNIRMVI